MMNILARPVETRSDGWRSDVCAYVSRAGRTVPPAGGRGLPPAGPGRWLHVPGGCWAAGARALEATARPPRVGDASWAMFRRLLFQPSPNPSSSYMIMRAFSSCHRGRAPTQPQALPKHPKRLGCKRQNGNCCVDKKRALIKCISVLRRFRLQLACAHAQGGGQLSSTPRDDLYPTPHRAHTPTTAQTRRNSRVRPYMGVAHARAVPTNPPGTVPTNPPGTVPTNPPGTVRLPPAWMQTH
jgi:hypothetical protein